MCGIFGIFNYKGASNITYLGLHALQHRGQESAGIVTTDGYAMQAHREMGLVSDIFNANVLANLRGYGAVGHVRYSTAGSSNLGNAQPLMFEYSKGFIAIAHNGNLMNAMLIKDELQNYGSIFQSTTDTEVIIHLIALSHENATLERLISALRRVEGLILPPCSDRQRGSSQQGTPMAFGLLCSEDFEIPMLFRARPVPLILSKHHISAKSNRGRFSTLPAKGSNRITPSSRRNHGTAYSNMFISPGRTVMSLAGLCIP